MISMSSVDDCDVVFFTVVKSHAVMDTVILIACRSDTQCHTFGLSLIGR